MSACWLASGTTLRTVASGSSTPISAVPSPPVRPTSATRWPAISRMTYGFAISSSVLETTALADSIGNFASAIRWRRAASPSPRSAGPSAIAS